MAPTRLPEGYEFQLGYRQEHPDGSVGATIVYTLDRRRPIHIHQSVAQAVALPNVDGWTGR